MEPSKTLLSLMEPSKASGSSAIGSAPWLSLTLQLRTPCAEKHYNIICKNIRGARSAADSYNVTKNSTQRIPAAAK